MSKIQIEKYAEANLEIWDEFISQSANGTIFHSRRFINYHPADRFEDHSLMFFKDKKLIAIFPSAIITKPNGKILKSHPGTSYGGLVIKNTLGVATSEAIYDELIDYARQNQCRFIEFRTAPKLYNKFFCDELEFIAHYKGFQPESIELSSYIDLRKFNSKTNIEEIISSYSDSAKRSTRKSLSSGLTVKYCNKREEFDSYWELLKNNLVKHKANPTHSKDELYFLKTIFPNDVQLVAVFKDNVMIAGITAFKCNELAAHTFYFASDSAYQHLRPLNLAVTQLIKWGLENHLLFLNFGISTENGGKVINYGLFRFKESFSAHDIIRTYWQLEL